VQLFSAMRIMMELFNPISFEFDLCSCRRLLQYLKEKNVPCLEMRLALQARGNVLLHALDGQLLWALPGRRPVRERLKNCS